MVVDIPDIARWRWETDRHRNSVNNAGDRPCQAARGGRDVCPTGLATRSRTSSRKGSDMLEPLLPYCSELSLLESLPAQPGRHKWREYAPIVASPFMAFVRGKADD